MVSMIFILLLSVASLKSAVSVVQTRSGPVEGILETYQDTLVDVFLGIPYATPPVGELRFRRTVSVQPWTEPLKANSYPPACVQHFPYKFPWVDQMPGQSEDCLYLNIWVPRSSNSTSEKSVMFWIHGGGFTSGSNRLKVYDGGVLAANGDVIVVTINYRLGVFGFLSTPSEEAPGNMGFYDMLEALKWVKSNIQAFGGDPDSITLFGESAGSKVIGLFCVSPLTTGLFRRIIMESGSPAKLVEDTSYQANLQLSVRLIAEVGCAQNNATLEENPVEIIQCLRSKDARILAYVADALNNFDVSTYNFIYGDAFLPTNPRLAVLGLQFHNVDVLIGNNQDEGAFELGVLKPELFGPFGEKNPPINKTLGSALISKLISTFPAPEEAVEYYLGGLQENDYVHIRSQVYHAFGDYVLFCPAVYFAESYAKKGNSVYYYYFNHQSTVTPWADWMGVVHTDEIPFVFGRPLDYAEAEEKPFEAHYTSQEEQLSKEMISVWTNFAKYGIPSVEWPTFSREKPYVRAFQLQEHRENYLEQHFANCEFYRPYFGKTSKVLICGYRSTGKTSILEQLIYGNFPCYAYPTIEDIYCALVNTDRGVKEKVRFYDTAGTVPGQPTDFLKTYMTYAEGVVLVYAINSRESFALLDQVKKEYDKVKEKKEVPILVLGNKMDLQNERQVDTGLAQAWAQKEKVKLYEVSALDRRSLTEPFVYLTSKMNPPPSKSSFPQLGKKGKAGSITMEL